MLCLTQHFRETYSLREMMSQTWRDGKDLSFKVVECWTWVRNHFIRMRSVKDRQRITVNTLAVYSCVALSSTILLRSGEQVCCHRRRKGCHQTLTWNLDSLLQNRRRGTDQTCSSQFLSHYARWSFLNHMQLINFADILLHVLVSCWTARVYRPKISQRPMLTDDTKT